MRTLIASIIALAAASGCSASPTTPGASSDSATSTATSTGSAGGATSSVGTGGAGGAGAAGGASQGGGGQGGGGQGGSGGTCPDVQCSTSCPEGYWNELDGCPGCACAPPETKLIVDGVTRNPAHTKLTTTPSLFIGGIDRWVFDFVWQYDDPAASDDAEDVTSTIRIMKIDPKYEPSDKDATWFYPADSGMPLEALGGKYTLYGFGVIAHDLTPVSGWLSIRRVGDTFEGGVWLVNDPVDGQGPTVEAHGSFSVPVPN